MVARDRQRAIDAAVTHADVLVLDGPLQLTPRRATLSLLAVHAQAPWGNQACPPVGDLRAPRIALERAADRVVTIGPGGDVMWRSLGAWFGSTLVSWADVRRKFTRIGLATGIARPGRVETLLAEHGIEPRRTVRVADHGALEVPDDAGIDLWLITGKDASRARLAGKCATIDYHLALPAGIEELLASRFSVRF
jgi:tetraacyldisaccharide-1-P 4'-kinase